MGAIILSIDSLVSVRERERERETERDREMSLSCPYHKVLKVSYCDNTLSVVCCASSVVNKMTTRLVTMSHL